MVETQKTEFIGFGDLKYWEKRYKESNEETFDWLENYTSLKKYLVKYLTDKDMHILVIGCGNARFSEDLYDDGFQNIVNNDISPAVIKHMTARNAESRPKMKWVVMDVTEMNSLEDNTFDLVIDKSTIDTLSCGDNSNIKVAMMLKESLRVLKVGGVNFTIALGKLKDRLPHY